MVMVKLAVTGILSNFVLGVLISWYSLSLGLNFVFTDTAYHCSITNSVQEHFLQLWSVVGFRSLAI